MNDIPEFQYFTKDHAVSMTTRDYFAAKSITWFLTALENEGLEDPALLRQFAAESAYRLADAMMKARDSK